MVCCSLYSDIALAIPKIQDGKTEMNIYFNPLYSGALFIRVFSQYDHLPVGLIAQLVVRTLHWHWRGHGFEFHSSLKFFRLSFHNCLRCVHNYDGHSLTVFHLQFKNLNFIQLFYFHLSSSPVPVGIYLQNDQLPVGLIAQLVEHCIGIAEVMGSHFFQAFCKCFSCGGTV